MATVIVMPALGNSVESCLIVSWLVKEGDTIAENGILCEVETDKALFVAAADVAVDLHRLRFVVYRDLALALHDLQLAQLLLRQDGRAHV